MNIFNWSLGRNHHRLSAIGDPCWFIVDTNIIEDLIRDAIYKNKGPSSKEEKEKEYVMAMISSRCIFTFFEQLGQSDYQVVPHNSNIFFLHKTWIIYNFKTWCVGRMLK